MTFDVFFAHKNDALQAEQRPDRGRRDTVLACVAYLRAMGGDWPDVLRMAALGAAAVCARHGTSVVTLNDIEMA